MIIDKEQFNQFIKILPDLQNDEVYFVSLSARQKYLTLKEREFYALGRTEMFSREIVKSKKDFPYIMNKLLYSLEYKTTRNGKQIPEKALVTYINVNPSSTIEAFYQFRKEMNRYKNEINKALMGNKEPNYTGILNINRKLMNCIQKSRSRKYYIDIDFDILPEDNDLLVDFQKYLITAKVKYHTIQTQGGYHVLIKKDTLNDKIKLHEKLKEYKSQLISGEVIINKNQMVPIPGTLQANKLVKLI